MGLWDIPKHLNLQNHTTMAIKLKAKETLQRVGDYAGQYRFVLNTELYNKLSENKVIQEAALRSGVSKGIMQACWDAAGEVIKAWATEGHSVALPGLGTMRFGVRAKSVDSVDKVASGIITSRRVIFTPNVDIKNVLKSTSISITCYDKDGNLIKSVTSGDDGDIEDPENEGGDDNTPSGGGSTPSGDNSTPSGGDTTPKTYTLNISSANTTQGTVNTSVNKAYNAGAVVNITATPKAGYAFDKWSDGNTSASRSVAMNKDLTLVAQFKVVEPATSVDGISITSIANQPNGGSTEVNVNAELVIRGTGLQKLTAANFVHSEGKVGTYEANSDGRAVLTYDNIEDNEQTVSVVVGGETLFTLNIKGNNVYEF